MRTVRIDTSRPRTKSLTNYQQVNKTNMIVKILRRDKAGHGMESLTSCPGQMTKVTVKTVREDTAGPGIESLTPCQANRTRVAVRTVRRDTAGPGMKSLTYCQANRTRVAVRSVRRDTAGSLDLAWNHSHTVKPTGSEWQ